MARFYISLRQNYSGMNKEMCNRLYDFFNDSEETVVKPVDFVKTGYGFLFLGVLIFYLSYIGYLDGWYLLSAAVFIIGLLLIRKKITSLFYFENAEALDEDTFSEIFLNCLNSEILQKAKHLLNIRKEIKNENCYIFCVPVFESLPGVEKETIKRKLVKNDTYIYSVWKINIIFIEESFIGYFSCIYNTFENKYFNNVTTEFYYSDITSVKIEYANKDFKYINTEDITTEQISLLTVSNISGDKIEFVSERPESNVFSAFSGNSEQLVRDLRKKIREKRFPGDKFSDKDIDFEVEDTRKKQE